MTDTTTLARPGAEDPRSSAIPDAYRRDVGDVTAILGVDPTVGLDDAVVVERQAAVGLNALAEPASRPAWLRFLDQFRSTLILVLIGAAVLAGLVGDIKDTVVISVVLLINATIGYVQERRAERSLDALRRMLVPTARVRRAGRAGVVAADQLVPGDVVLLEAGDRVPADGRLVTAESLEVDESAFTGESVPVAKSLAVPEPAGEDGAVPLADRRNVLFMNTTLTRGRAELVVTATGMDTEIGEVAEALRSGDTQQTPLQRRLDTLGKRLAAVGVAAVLVYAALALARGDALADLAIRAVALAVATVPEGLPAVLALTLALGVHRMVRTGAIVKRLASVETLGSATVVCSDKTGTLTLNQMTVRALVASGRSHTVTGEGYDPSGAVLDADGEPLAEVPAAVRTFALCADAHLSEDGGIVGDPTEGALVVLAAKLGVDADALRRDDPRVAELPFDAAHKYMATVHREPDDPTPHLDGGRPHRVVVHVKGAVDVLLDHCSHVQRPDGVAVLDDEQRAAVHAEVERLAGEGLRVLGAATVRLPDLPGDEESLRSAVAGMTLLGLVGIADPPRHEAGEAVALCHRAGVAVKMITGDHAATASAVARELGIRGRTVTGAQLDRMSAEELAAEIDGIGVFARVSPHHKVAIVEALRSGGHIVAMTGDGVNDAAALRSADIGVAMGITGTEVTKEAADMILTDDDFATIAKAVREGRGIYDNVLKFIRFQLSTNAGAVLTFLGAASAGVASPLTAIQVLWVNIIMDGPPAMAMGVDPARKGIMNDPPRRPDESILSPVLLWRLLRVGVVMAGGTLAVLFWARSEFDPLVGSTMAFTTFVFFQLFNAFNARAGVDSVFTSHLFTNRPLWISLGTVLVLQVLAVQLPLLHLVFDTTSLTPTQWLTCAAVAVSVLLSEELIKLVGRVARSASDRAAADAGAGEPARQELAGA